MHIMIFSTGEIHVTGKPQFYQSVEGNTFYLYGSFIFCFCLKEAQGSLHMFKEQTKHTDKNT